MSAGRFSAQKDFQTLLKAFALYAENHTGTLVLFGDGELRLELEALAKKLGISDKVVFAGFKNPLYPFYKLADVDIFTIDVKTDSVCFARLYRSSRHAGTNKDKTREIVGPQLVKSYCLYRWGFHLVFPVLSGHGRPVGRTRPSASPRQ
jgi:hypothetical protein